MRWVLALWGLPLALFWGWYFLSLNDVNFGYLILSRQVHDILFGLYGDILGIDAGLIPWLIAKACIVDTAIIGGILAYRRRREIRVWLDERRAMRAVADREPVPVFVVAQEGARVAPRGHLAGD